MEECESPAKVLVVDDRPDVADAFAALVRSLGHIAQVAYEAAKAIEIARSLQPDIAIVDLTMGDADGVGLAEQLRADAADRRMRLVAMSGYDVDPMRLHGAPRFDEFLTKPPELDALQRMLRDFRGMRRDR